MRRLLGIASLFWTVAGVSLVSAVAVTAIRAQELPHVWGSCDMKGAEKGGPLRDPPVAAGTMIPPD